MQTLIIGVAGGTGSGKSTFNITTVKPMHYQYVEPTKVLADIVINSGRNDVAFDIVRTKIEAVLNETE